MALPGIIQAAPDGARGFDADSKISLEVAQQFAQQGFSFCLRYLSRGTRESTRDLTATEAEDILSAGLGLMAVQHVRIAGWSPLAEMGQADGINAARNAGTVGFPPGVNIWCDLEGVNPASLEQGVAGYCRGWFNAVEAAGYVPGLYVGPQAILNGQQLFDLPFEHYWKSASKVPALPVRGYQMVQSLVDGPVNGISIDGDTTQTDSKGGQAIWLIAGGE